MKQEIIPSLEKGLAVLEIINFSPDGITFEQLLKETAITRTTLFRILKTLEKNNYLEKKDNKFFPAAFAGIKRDNYLAEIRKISLPYMEKLLAITGETVEFGILDKGRIFYVIKQEALDYSVKMLFEEGKHHHHMHASGICKVLLSFLPEKDIRQIIDRDGIEKFTDLKTTSE